MIQFVKSGSSPRKNFFFFFHAEYETNYIYFYELVSVLSAHLIWFYLLSFVSSRISSLLSELIWSTSDESWCSACGDPEASVSKKKNLDIIRRNNTLNAWKLPVYQNAWATASTADKKQNKPKTIKLLKCVI